MDNNAPELRGGFQGGKGVSNAKFSNSHQKFEYSQNAMTGC